MICIKAKDFIRKCKTHVIWNCVCVSCLHVHVWVKCEYEKEYKFTNCSKRTTLNSLHELCDSITAAGSLGSASEPDYKSSFPSMHLCLSHHTVFVPHVSSSWQIRWLGLTGQCSHGRSRPATCTGRTPTCSISSPRTTTPTTVTMTTSIAPSSMPEGGLCGTVREQGHRVWREERFHLTEKQKVDIKINFFPSLLLQNTFRLRVPASTPWDPMVTPGKHSGWPSPSSTHCGGNSRNSWSSSELTKKVSLCSTLKWYFSFCHCFTFVFGHIKHFKAFKRQKHKAGGTYVLYTKRLWS